MKLFNAVVVGSFLLATPSALAECLTCQQNQVMPALPENPMTMEDLAQTQCSELPSELTTFPEKKEGESTQWLRTTRTGGKKGIAIVVHGLNYRPTKMQPVAKIFQDQGYDVLQVSLSGHGGDGESLETIKSVKAESWLKDILFAYCGARQEADAGGLPLVYSGYSLGGLLGETILNAPLGEQVKFDRMVLFAPALELTSFGKLALNLMRPLRGKIVTPNLMPAGYAANPEGVPVSAWDALAKVRGLYKKSGMARANIPTDIFVDKKDELVSGNGILKTMQENLLSNWTIHTISNKEGTLPKKFHHMIVDEPSLGSNQWSYVTDYLGNMLSSIGSKSTP